MFKKLLVVAAMLAVSASAFAAGAPYVGAGVGVNTDTFNLKDNQNGATETFGGRGALANIFAGYGATVNQNIYLGGEVFAKINSTSSVAQGTDAHGNLAKLTFKDRYGYGVSFIPGYMLSNDTMLYARAGLIRSNFLVKGSTSTSTNTVSRSSTGGQLGVGLQTSLTKNVDLRGEYVYTSYNSFKVVRGSHTSISPKSDQYSLALIYKFS